MYATEGSNVSFQIPNMTLPQFIWANEMEECICPSYINITHCACNINTLSSSYSDNTIYLSNLTVQANNTKVYLVNSRSMPINLREIYKAYQIIIILGKYVDQEFIQLGWVGGWVGGGEKLNF